MQTDEQQVRPSDFRRHHNLVDYLERYTSAVIDRHTRLLDGVGIIIRRLASKLNSRHTAMEEGEMFEGADETQEWIDEQLDQMGFSEIAGTGEEIENAMADPDGNLGGKSNPIANDEYYTPDEIPNENRENGGEN